MVSNCSFLRCVMEQMQDAVTKPREIAEAESIAFQDFNLIVAAFGKTIGVSAVKGIKNADRPAKHSICTSDKSRKSTVLCGHTLDFIALVAEKF